MTSAFPSRYEGPGESPGLLMWQATMHWQRVMRETLAEHGLTHTQFVLLASLCWLESQEGPVNQARIADHARLDPMMTSQVLRALERNGWLDRKDHPGDARAFLLRPTRRGRSLIRKALPAVEAADAAFFGVLGNSLRGFIAGLRKLA